MIRPCFRLARHLLALVAAVAIFDAAAQSAFTAVTLERAASLSNSSLYVDTRSAGFAVSVFPYGGNRLTVRLTGPANTFYDIALGAPLDQPLLPGPYEDAWQDGPGSSPRLGASVGGCSPDGGRFVIHELALAGDGSVSALAASFDQWCAVGTPVYGQIRINSTIPLPDMLSTPGDTPYPFSLNAQSPVAAGSLVRSNVVTVDGITQAVPVSIIGGQYSLNGGAYTSAPGIANLHDEIRVQLVASRTPGAVKSATLTAGGRSATLAATTFESGMQLNGLYFQSTTGDYIGKGQTRLMLAPPGSLATRLIYGNAVEAHIDAPRGSWWYLDLAAPQGALLASGTYENASRWPFQAPTQPGLAFVGEGAGCNQIFGRFVVHEATYANDGTVQRLAADFEQHCETATAPPLHGELRYNSTVPFSALVNGDGPPAALSALSTRGHVLQGDDVMIAGFIIAGPTPKTVVIRARGPSLPVAGALTDPVLTVVPALGGSAMFNDDWQSDANAAALAASGLAPSHAREAAILATLQPGAYTGIVSGARGETGVAIVEVYEVDHPEIPMSAISTRARVDTGDNVAIAGFIIGGSVPQTVLLRARGPSLAAQGVPDPLANPTLTLVRASDGTIVEFSDDWQSGPKAAEIAASGWQPTHPAESAILVTLAPGGYTAVFGGAGGATGVGIVEVFAAP